MLAGFLLVAVTGLIWTAVGIIYSEVIGKKVDFIGFMLSYTVVLTAFVWCFRTPAAAPSAEVLKTAAAIIPASIFGIGGFFAMFLAMRGGSHAVAWTFGQSAMVIPFLGGWLCFGNRTTLLNWLGMAVITAAMVMTGKGKSQQESGGKSDLKWSIAAFFMIGIGQFLNLLPGESGLGEPALSWRLPLQVLPGILIWGSISLVRKNFPSKAAVRAGGLYGVVVALGQITLYMAIDQLGRYNLTNIVFPSAISICIILFSLFCVIWRKEHLSTLCIAGVFFLVCGTALLFC